MSLPRQSDRAHPERVQVFAPISSPTEVNAEECRQKENKDYRSQSPAREDPTLGMTLDQSPFRSPGRREPPSSFRPHEVVVEINSPVPGLFDQAQLCHLLDACRQIGGSHSRLALELILGDPA